MSEVIKNAVRTFAAACMSAIGIGSAGINYFYIFLISMLPVIELRGAIPAAYALRLNPINSYITAVIGNMLPVPFILILITPLCNWLRKKRMFSWFPDMLEKKAEKNREKVTKYATLGLFLFVAIPLPGTGAWTGALVASFLDFRFRDAFISILLGVLTAGILVSALSYGIFGIIMG